MKLSERHLHQGPLPFLRIVLEEWQVLWTIEQWMQARQAGPCCFVVTHIVKSHSTEAKFVWDNGIRAGTE